MIVSVAGRVLGGPLRHRGRAGDLGGDLADRRGHLLARGRHRLDIGRGLLGGRGDAEGLPGCLVGGAAHRPRRGLHLGGGGGQAVGQARDLRLEPPRRGVQDLGPAHLRGALDRGGGVGVALGDHGVLEDLDRPGHRADLVPALRARHVGRDVAVGQLGHGAGHAAERAHDQGQHGVEAEADGGGGQGDEGQQRQARLARMGLGAVELGLRLPDLQRGELAQDGVGLLLALDQSRVGRVEVGRAAGGEAVQDVGRDRGVVVDPTLHLGGEALLLRGEVGRQVGRPLGPETGEVRLDLRAGLAGLPLPVSQRARRRQQIVIGIADQAELPQRDDAVAEDGVEAPVIRRQGEIADPRGEEQQKAHHAKQRDQAAFDGGEHAVICRKDGRVSGPPSVRRTAPVSWTNLVCRSDEDRFISGSIALACP